MWCSRTITRFLLTGLTTGFQVLLALYIPLYNQIPTKSEKSKIKEKKKKNKNKNKNKNKIFFFFFFHLDTERFFVHFSLFSFVRFFYRYSFFLLFFEHESSDPIPLHQHSAFLVPIRVIVISIHLGACAIL